jgi:hypothetical protein
VTGSAAEDSLAKDDTFAVVVAAAVVAAVVEVIASVAAAVTEDALVALAVFASCSIVWSARCLFRFVGTGMIGATLACITGSGAVATEGGAGYLCKVLCNCCGCCRANGCCGFQSAVLFFVFVFRLGGGGGAPTYEGLQRGTGGCLGRGL